MNFRPKLSLLRNEDVERIISSAYDLLATAGVKIKHEEGLQILSDHGASVDFSTQVAMMPLDLVEKCLKTVPSSLEFYLKELFVPSKDIIGRTSYTKYVENGSREIFVRAREKKYELLNTYKAPAIDMHTLDEMKRILIEYAKKKGEEIPEFIFNY